MKTKLEILEDFLTRVLTDEENKQLRWDMLEDEVHELFAAQLEDRRHQLDFTQGRMAEAAWTSQSAVSRFLSATDERSPTLQTLVRLADVLGLRLRIELDPVESIQDGGWENHPPSTGSIWTAKTSAATKGSAVERTRKVWSECTVFDGGRDWESEPAENGVVKNG